MRARLVNEDFKRGLDPKEAMSIGRLADIPMSKIHNAPACLRNYSLEDLQKMYERIRAKNNIKLDGVPIENLSYSEWVTFNNKIVNGIKAFKRKVTKSKIKDSGYSPGEILKATHKGKTYFGAYVGVDRNGRIQAVGNEIKLALNAENYIKASQEEVEKFIEDKIRLEKKRKERNIESIKRSLNVQWPQETRDRIQFKLETAIRDYENTFKEKYPGF
jgi:hypothetical protein